MNRDPATSEAAAMSTRAPFADRRNRLPPQFDGLAQLAASICEAPFASLVLTGWGESWHGLGTRALPTGRDPFFDHVVSASGVFEVRDAARDPRFATTLVKGAPAVRGFAGCALRGPHGEAIGVLAVYDDKARRLSANQRAMILLLARQCAAHSALHARVAELEILGTDEQVLHKAFRNTFDQAPIGIAYADRAGKFLRFNNAFCALLGFAASELSGLSMGELTHAGDAQAAGAALGRLWSGEAEFLDFEKRYMRKDGSCIWVRTTTALVRDGDRAECSVEYLRDITQRKDLTAQLIQQRTLLEAVISDLPLALLACDVEGTITHYNRAAVEMHCVEPSDSKLLVDVYLMDGVTPVSEGDGPLARALRGETISNLELTVIPSESTPRTTLSSARRLIGPEGQVLGAVAVIQDTTERKYQEMELERVHRQLLAASREAGMAEVATNVLHNVGNILNSVNISASLVAERVRLSKASGVSRLAGLLLEQGADAGRFITEDGRGKKIPEYLSALGEQLQTDQRSTLEELALLRDNLEHIKDTVTMQQSYAKLCGVTETVEVADLVEDSLRLNAGAFARHGVALEREFGDTPKINVDKHKVLQILVNLVRNAKYACDDSGRADKLITLRTERTERGVRISVIDNGIGIPAQNMGRLFRHGFTTRESGHGFGLHSGALAAQELGGSLHAESEGTGRGASFILELPSSPPQDPRA